MPDEPQITAADLENAFGKSNRWVKPALIGSAAVVVLLALFFVGKFLLSHDTASNESEMAANLPHNSEDTSGIASLLYDTLELGISDIVDPADTIQLPIVAMTNSILDSTEYYEIPGVDYLDDSELLNGIVNADEARLDPTMEFNLAIASPLKEDAEFDMSKFWSRDSDQPVEAQIDTMAFIASLGPRLAGASKAELDSMANVVRSKEESLQLLASDNQRLSNKLNRYKTEIDSARNAQIKKLVKILETMSPGAAASMLSSQTPDEITEVLFKVKPRKAAQILQQLPGSIATDIAVKVMRQ